MVERPFYDLAWNTLTATRNKRLGAHLLPARRNGEPFYTIIENLNCTTSHDVGTPIYDGFAHWRILSLV